MLQKPGWAQSLARWQAFWNGNVADRPPTQVALLSRFESDIEGSSRESTIADAILERHLAYHDPSRNAELLTQAEAALWSRADTPDDSPPALVAGGGVYFTGAAFGAPLAETARMLVAEPILHDWSQAASLRYDAGNPWIQRALRLARQLVTRSGGRYAVTAGLLEGPSDICAALRGVTQLAEDIAACPSEVRTLARMAADAWTQYLRAMHEVVPLYDGGTVTQWGLWAPGRAAAFQEDFCTVISPADYRAVFKDFDRELARQVDVFWVHVHAGQIHLVDELLSMEEVRGVQIVNDGAASPPMMRVLPAMQRVQARGKCLIVRKYSPEQLGDILEQLSPRGLAIDTFCPTVAAARAWLRRLEEWSQRRG